MPYLYQQEHAAFYENYSLFEKGEKNGIVIKRDVVYPEGEPTFIYVAELFYKGRVMHIGRSESEKGIEREVNEFLECTGAFSHLAKEKEYEYVRRFELWHRGIHEMGMDEPTPPQFIGYGWGRSLKEACQNLAKTDGSFEQLFNEKHMTYWGYHIYETERDAAERY